MAFVFGVYIHACEWVCIDEMLECGYMCAKTVVLTIYVLNWIELKVSILWWGECWWIVQVPL